MKRNAFVYIQITLLAIAAVIPMTVFLRIKMHKDRDGGVFYTVPLFFSVIMLMFVGMAKLSMSIAKLVVFYKQRDLLRILPTIVEVVLRVSTTYCVIEYDPNVGRSFTQLLLLELVNQRAFKLFRFIGTLRRNTIIANTFWSFALFPLLALGSFILAQKELKKWWIGGHCEQNIIVYEY
ncbi:hypothetical protein Nepgr_020544 [Nepenthes gracilis]|uniref:ABC-2 type transporter transmembrane domain-containing protein n=1 Tax=Nepenthes gracilis TaxID=150966 RepID=A0AAD3XVB3_NEPGR|nr:hypothetical protein Nepgr_020544 [Nepenthes gracilis]